MLSLRPGCAFALALSAIALSNAGVPAFAAPARSSLNSPAMQVDQYLRAQMRRLRIPGLQVAVVRRGRIVMLRSYGVASIELSVPMTNQIVLPVNSITKAFTGVAAMRLVAAGRLDLSAPVSTYLDGLPEAWRAITIRQLLSHMSGLPDLNRAPTIETDQEAAWTWVQSQPVRFPAGERFDYCQTNYALIQRVINRLLSVAPDTPLAGGQFETAGMTRTRYGDSTEVVPGKAPAYRFTYATPTSPGVLRPVTERFLPISRAASGLNSTAEDMAHWIIALQQGHILDRAALDSMWTPVAFSNGLPGQWGMGWQILPRGNDRAVGMTGGGRAAFYLYPRHDVAIVLLTNLAGSFPEDLIDRIASFYAPGLQLGGVPALRIALEERGYAQAATVAAEMAAHDPGLRWNEAELNDWGYRLLTSGRPREGLELLKLVVALFPGSGNAFDSVAEAYAVNGDRAAAIANYRRSLELDPANTNAQRRLQRLEAAGGAAERPPL
jgi:CubicO group peptidase (beta-lactamase class C family)